MKTTKQQLIDNPVTMSNETDLLFGFYSEKINKFCIEFNAKLFTFKTLSGYINKQDYFINKYNLHF